MTKRKTITIFIALIILLIITNIFNGLKISQAITKQAIVSINVLLILGIITSIIYYTVKYINKANLNKGYDDIINDIMKATYYNARFAEKPGTISKATFMKHIYDLNPPKVKTNPLEYFKDGNIKDLLKSKAYYDNVNNKIVINPLSLLFNDNNSYKGLIAHEATHAFKDFNPLRLSIFDKGPYHIPNPELGSVLKPFNRAASKGKWEGSPEELRAEMYNWKYMLDDLFTPYKNSKNKKRYIKEAMNRFYLNKYETARTLDALSNLGYF